MNQFVVVHNGTYRNAPITGKFPLYASWKQGKLGSYITVLNSNRPIRIKCEMGDFQIVDAAGAVIAMQQSPVQAITDDNISESREITLSDEQKYLSIETEADAMQRIRRNFEILDEMTGACCKGLVRALIVSGPPGIGKSFGVEKILSEFNTFQNLSDTSERTLTVKGFATPIALYKILYNYRYKHNCIVFDDCDSVFGDSIALNLLKAALDSGGKRFISWNSESRVLKEESIPDRFEFSGSVIFLTNLDFDHCRSRSLEPHLKALKSRCLYLNLEISSTSDLLLRIRQIVKDGMLEIYDFPQHVEAELLEFITNNVNDLNELSLRTIKKVADLRSTNPDNWQELALHTVMKKEARFRWYLKAKEDTETKVKKTKVKAKC